MSNFDTIDSFRNCLKGLPGPDEAARAAAATRDSQLTKPPGALGRLEEIALWMAAWQGTDRPQLTTPQVLIFAGNHGVAARGVSAFPPEVTAQMVANFQHGGAAINQLSDCFGAQLDVHALSLDTPTADFTETAAMSETELVDALQVGWNAVSPDADLVIAGEMGIANTTSAAALATALLDGAPADWVGRGTGLDDAGLALKTEVVAEGLLRHADYLGDPLEVLRRLGGREIAAMAGAIAGARAHRIPVLLDGFICSSAALVLAKTTPGALDHVMAGHVSAETAHQRMLEALGKTPLLSLGLRLGEGSGAALALGIVKGAVACHSGMSTFAEAGVAAG